jgi:hypothetical protein
MQIDRHDGAVEAAFEEIARDDGTDRFRTPAGADQSDGGRLEECVEVADGHRWLPALWRSIMAASKAGNPPSEPPIR